MTNFDDRILLARTALGPERPDTVFHAPRLYNPWTGRIEAADIWVKRGRIARLAELGTETGEAPVIDLSGGIAVPGFVDGHIHFESTLLAPERFAEIALGLGVTSIVTDYHEIGCVLGFAGIAEMADRFAKTPLKVFGLSPCPLPYIPEFEKTRSSLSLSEVETLLERPDFIGLSEVIGAELVRFRPELLEALRTADAMGALIEGHLFRSFGASIDACAAFGVDSDHEPRAVEEVVEKLRRGIFMMLRQGTVARETERLAPALAASGIDLTNIAFVTDDMLPTDMRDKGYFSERLRTVAAAGYPALSALRAVTLAPAIHYGIQREVGSFRPGCRADLVLLEDLTSFKVLKAYANGIDQSAAVPAASKAWPPEFLDTIEFGKTAAELDREIRERCPSGARTVRALYLDERNRFTHLTERSVDFRSGGADFLGEDTSYLLCLNRVSGEFGLGFLAGYGLDSGAIAISMAHDHHNITAVGRDLRSLVTSIMRLKELGGGIVLIGDDLRIAAEYPMPIGGLLSDLPKKEALDRLDLLVKTLRDRGASWSQPLFFLFFLAMPVAPEFRITESGILETETGRIVPIF